MIIPSNSLTGISDPYMISSTFIFLYQIIIADHKTTTRINNPHITLYIKFKGLPKKEIFGLAKPKNLGER